MIDVIGLDCDEIVFNFTDPFLGWINGVRHTNFTRKDVKSYSYEESGIIPVGTNGKYIKEFSDQFLADLPLMPFAKEAIWHLSRFAKLRYVTSRNPIYRDATEEAFRRHFGRVPHIEFSSRKGEDKAAIVARLKCDIFVDDSPTFITEIFKKCPMTRTILLSEIKACHDAASCDLNAYDWPQATVLIDRLAGRR